MKAESGNGAVESSLLAGLMGPDGAFGKSALPLGSWLRVVGRGAAVSEKLALPFCLKDGGGRASSAS